MTRLLDGKGGYNFNEVKRWFKKVNILDYEKWIFPVNHNNYHWFLTHACFGKNFIEYYDSGTYLTKSDAKKHLNGMVKCIGDVLKLQRCRGAINEWTSVEFNKIRVKCPLQPNRKLFVIMFSNYL